MKIKRSALLLALVLCMSAFAMPMTAFAAGDSAPPTLTAVLDGDKLNIESSDENSGVEAVYIDGNRVNSLVDGRASVLLKDYAGNNKRVSVYAVDGAGNRSETVKLDNPYYQAPVTQAPSASSGSGNSQSQTQAPSSTQSPSANPGGSGNTQSSGNGNSGGGASANPNGTQSSNNGQAAGGSDAADQTGGTEDSVSSIPDGAFTPEGTGTVLDQATGADEKYFYTITTENGNVFYLIVDGKRDENNVYFLNGVTEADLLALAEKEDGTISTVPPVETCTCTDKCEAGKVNTACTVCKNDLTGCTGKAAQTDEPENPDTETPKADKGNTGMIIFIVIAVLVIGAVGYYVKIIRPKRQSGEDDEDFEDDGYGEGFDPDDAYGDPEYLPDDEETNGDSD